MPREIDGLPFLLLSKKAIESKSKIRPKQSFV